MKYLRAKSGIHYLYHEAIVSMTFASICLIETLCTIFDAIEPVLITIRALVVIALLLSLVGLLLMAIGIYKAAQDEPLFYKAFYLIIACAVLLYTGAALEFIFGSSSFIIFTINAIGDFFKLFVMTLVVKGIYAIFVKMDKAEIVKESNGMCHWIRIALITALILNIVSIIIPKNNKTLEIITIILGVLSNLIEFAISCQFLIYLRKVIKHFHLEEQLEELD